MSALVRLPRGVIEVAGDDRVGFLQGLVSNDVEQAGPGRCVWAALLTPQGKWLADFFIFGSGDRLLVDCEATQAVGLAQRLSRFRLRSRVSVRVVEDLAVYAGLDGADGAIAAPDPRLADAGWRMIGAPGVAETADFADWDRRRLALGLPDGSRDLEAERSVLLEAGFDELNGISWSKGCYMGQELTARTRYRGLVKRRLVPVLVHGPAPEPGTPVLREGAEAGTMRSSCGDLGLALLRLEALGGALVCGEARLEPRIPAWMQLPETVR